MVSSSLSYREILPVLLLLLPSTTSFLLPAKPFRSLKPLNVMIGTGPKEDSKYENYTRFRDGVEYEFAWNCEYRPKEDVEEPDHELYRKARLSEMDVTCDEWFEKLLVLGEEETEREPLGEVSREMWERLHTPVELVHDPKRQWFQGFEEDESWSPYGHFRLPGKINYPAFGLENYGLPTPRQFSEVWRHFDVPGLVNTDYSLTPENFGTELELDSDQSTHYQTILQTTGTWMSDSEVTARLIYINGRFVPSLSKTTDRVHHLSPQSFTETSPPRDEIIEALKHLPDGYTDILPTEDGQENLQEIAGSKTFSGLSAPDHNFRRATSQFAMNHQQGMAAFAALNSLKTGGVALVDAEPCEDVIRKINEKEEEEMAIKTKPMELKREAVEEFIEDLQEEREMPKPILIINAQSSDLGVGSAEDGKGAAVHPRTLIMANKGSKLNVVQQSVDLDDPSSSNTSRPKLYNGYTQIFVRSGATVKHCYIDETGGQVTPDVEEAGDEVYDIPPAVIEANRPALKDTHFEMIDVQCTGRYGSYKGTHVGMGGSGKVKIAAAASLLQKFTHAEFHGMLISGGAQDADMRGVIHHVSPMSTGNHYQRNIVGGCADATWKGRIRMDAECHYSEGDQLCKTLLLSDEAHILAMPTLDIICDTVKCAHGATVADLSDEEMLYLQTRGLSRLQARSLLMYGFVDEIGQTIDPVIFGRLLGSGKMRARMLRQLTNMVPRGERSIMWEYRSI